MKLARRFVKPVSAVVLSAAVMAQAPQGEIHQHVAAARAAADSDFRNTLVNLCPIGAAPAAARGASAPAAGQPARGRGAGGTPPVPDRTTWYAPPFKVFDNLYWLGTRQHSSWALQTSEGIIVLDTNFALGDGAGNHRRSHHTRPESPRLKYVIISHAHGDHDQGAARAAEAVRRQGRDGRGRLGGDAAAAGTAAGGVPTRDVAVGPEG